MPIVIMLSASPTHAPLLYSYIHNTVKKLENAKSQDYPPKCLYNFLIYSLVKRALATYNKIKYRFKE